MVMKSLHTIGKDVFLPFANLNISIPSSSFALASVSASAFKHKHANKHLLVSKRSWRCLFCLPKRAIFSLLITLEDFLKTSWMTRICYGLKNLFLIRIKEIILNKFSIKHFFSKCDQVCSFYWRNLSWKTSFFAHYLNNNNNNHHHHHHHHHHHLNLNLE